MKIIAIVLLLLLAGASHTSPCHSSPCPSKPVDCPTCK
jgi:hypothetical protein